MQTVDISGIKDELKEWRELRHLTELEQRKGILANIAEEFGELISAKDDNETIDALCDICVFIINSYPEIKNEYSLFVSSSYLEIEKEILVNYHNFKSVYLSSAISFKTYVELEKILERCFFYMVSLKYNPLKCLEETIKEISSRTGKWDEERAKFIKDKGTYKTKKELLTCPNGDILDTMNGWTHIEELSDMYIIKRDDTVIGTIKKWYKANYENCEIV